MKDVFYTQFRASKNLFCTCINKKSFNELQLLDNISIRFICCEGVFRILEKFDCQLIRYCIYEGKELTHYFNYAYDKLCELLTTGRVLLNQWLDLIDILMIYEIHNIIGFY